MTDFSSDIFQIIRDAVDFASLVREETGKQVENGRGFCPLHVQRSESPAFIIDSDGRGHCFSCQFDGDVVDFWSKLQGFNSQFEAARDLAQNRRVPLPETDPEAVERIKERRRREDVALGRAEANHRRLEQEQGKSPQARKAREYLEGRGFGKNLRLKFLLGVTRGGDISIPYWSGGRVHGIVRRTWGGDGRGKYMVPRTEEMPLGRKPLMIKDALPAGCIVLQVEGFLDHLALCAAGIPSIGIGCAKPSADQIEDMKDLIRRDHEIVVLPDNDKEGTGVKAARRTVQRLYPSARMTDFLPDPEHKDAADLFKASRGGSEAVKAVLRDLIKGSSDAVSLALEDLPEGGVQKIRRLKESVLPLLLRLSASERDAVIKDVAGAAKLSQETIKKALLEVESGIAGGEEAEEEIPEEEWACLLEGGALGKYTEDAAKIRGVVGDRAVLKLITLAAVSSQLVQMIGDTPPGVSLMISGEASRGKNYLTDAAVSMLPPEWIVGFEIASSQAFYYAVENDPEFLTHKFIYPNEVEAVDTVIEFLRPMLSQGRATKYVTNKSGEGRHEIQTIEVEGPITGVIPTVRNKIDDQLQSRLLTIGLADVKNRIELHTRAISRRYSPNWVDDYDPTLVERWRTAIRSLSEVRLVAMPFSDDDRFAFTNEEVSHGSRLWRSLLGLVSAHAWMEQRNREIRTLSDGRRAVIAIPADYRAAYYLFKATAERSVLSLDGRLRDIVQAVYDLSQETMVPDMGFSSQKIATRVRKNTGQNMSKGTVSKNRAYLTMSVGILYQTEKGQLAISPDVTPADWNEGDPMKGVPTPASVMRYRPERTDPRPRKRRRNEETVKETPPRNGEEPVSWSGNGQETEETTARLDAGIPLRNGETGDPDPGNGHLDLSGEEEAIYWRLREENPEMTFGEAVRRAREEAK
jgi:CHC2 zinc finger